VFETWACTLPTIKVPAPKRNFFVTMAPCPQSLRRLSSRDTLSGMTIGLQRYAGAGDFHFITCSCYRRQPLLGTARRRNLFLTVLEQVRLRYRLVVAGYVVMPEHFHLLIGEPHTKDPATVMQALKLGFARRVLAEKRRNNPVQESLLEHTLQHIWQRRYYDFNIFTRRKYVEERRYIHRNPVKRGLVTSPELWRWSSYRSYAYGEPGPVRLNEAPPVQPLKIRPPSAYTVPSAEKPTSRKPRDVRHPQHGSVKTRTEPDRYHRKRCGPPAIFHPQTIFCSPTIRIITNSDLTY